MKINCVIGPYLPIPPVRGGAVERIFFSLCIEFARQGHQVTILSRQYPGLDSCDFCEGVRFLRVPSFDAPSNPIFYQALDFLYALRVIRVLPPADVTITHSFTLPLIVPRSISGILYVSVGRYPKGQMRLYRRADRLQAVSTSVEKAIKEQSPSVGHLTKTIPNCISHSFASSINQPSIRREKRILFVGRIAKEKGIDLLIRAFGLTVNQFPDWRLDVIGPFEAKDGGDGTKFVEHLRAAAAPLGQRVTFLGPIFDEAALIEHMKRSAIFAYPSVAERGESFGLAPLEAMACGCAVIVSNLPCFSDFLKSGENGVAFDQEDVTGTALAKQLSYLMHSESLRDKLSAIARKTAQGFSPSRVAENFIADFDELLALRLR